MHSLQSSTEEEQQLRIMPTMLSRSGLSDGTSDCSRQSSTCSESDSGDLNSSLDEVSVAKMRTITNPFFGGEQQSPDQIKTTDQLQELVSQSLATVNRSIELMKALQQIEADKDTKSEKEVLISKLQTILDSCKKQVVAAVHPRQRNRVLPPPNIQELDEFPLLFGRCFNLSLNLKILNTSHDRTVDPNIAARIVHDLSVLQISLKSRLNSVSAMFNDLQITPLQRPKLGAS